MALPRVLVVIDEVNKRSLGLTNLQVKGCDVLVTPGSPDVLAILKRIQPDLVVFDLTMRGVDGFEFCRQLCQSADSSLIALNLHGNVPEMLHCLDMGAADYLGKPFGADELMARIWAVLRRRQIAGPHRPLNLFDEKATSEELQINRKRQLENSIVFPLDVNRERSSVDLMDKPFSATCWRQGVMYEAEFLEELAPFRVLFDRTHNELN